MLRDSVRIDEVTPLQDDCLSTVWHELRSPLSHVYRASQIMEIFLQADQRSTASERGVRRYLRILHLECQREIRLVNNLLDLSRLEAGGQMSRLTCIDLAPWMVQFVEAFSSRMKQQKQYLVLDFVATLPRLTTDLNCLEQAVAELMHNACRYTPAGEAIEIEMEATTALLILRIKNSGMAIPAADLPHIFDKFYRLPVHDSWQQGGIGLGLALVKKRIEQLKGSISASSDATWTCFTIELPWDLQ